MGVSNQIKALLSLSGMKQIDLMGALGMASRQSLSNKVAGERWSAADLIKIAEATGSKLAFILPSGERVVLSDDPGKPTGGILSASVEGSGYPSK